MKKLTRLKLINWHRFSDVTIDFGDSTLISGENGAGKSTLLDAIQFVVTCSTNHFNKAAHENGKRKLTGYIRCKTGRENHPYERTGEISAHVAFVFANNLMFLLLNDLNSVMVRGLFPILNISSSNITLSMR